MKVTNDSAPSSVHRPEPLENPEEDQCYTNFASFPNAVATLIQIALGMEYSVILGQVPDSARQLPR